MLVIVEHKELRGHTGLNAINTEGLLCASWDGTSQTITAWLLMEGRGSVQLPLLQELKHSEDLSNTRPLDRVTHDESLFSKCSPGVWFQALNITC